MTDGKDVETASVNGIELASSNVDARVESKLTALAPEQLEIVRRGAEIIKSGGLVAFPTETVYGLGANALDAEAVRRIYETKGQSVGQSADPPCVVDRDDRRAGRTQLARTYADGKILARSALDSPSRKGGNPIAHARRPA